jgi:hypothetical protein
MPTQRPQSSCRTTLARSTIRTAATSASDLARPCASTSKAWCRLPKRSHNTRQPARQKCHNLSCNQNATTQKSAAAVQWYLTVAMLLAYIALIHVCKGLPLEYSQTSDQNEPADMMLQTTGGYARVLGVSYVLAAAVFQIKMQLPLPGAALHRTPHTPTTPSSRMH